VIEISLDLYINFNFDFLDLHNVVFENYFANELSRSIVLKQFKTFACSACFIRPKDTRLPLVSLYLIKHYSTAAHVLNSTYNKGLKSIYLKRLKVDRSNGFSLFKTSITLET
jgi:hypothetical protein